MIKKILKFLKTAIISMIVVLLFVFIISFTVVKLCKENFVMAIDLLEMITIETDAEIQTISPVLENNTLTNHPTFGTQYASLKIESIGIDLPVYFGESYSILKSGIGQDSSSYFPRRRWKYSIYGA